MKFIDIPRKVGTVSTPRGAENKNHLHMTKLLRQVRFSKI